MKSMIFAWEQMHHYRKLLRWSWTSRGLITLEEMRSLHPDLGEGDMYPDDPEAGVPFKEMVPDIPVLVPSLASFHT